MWKRDEGKIRPRTAPQPVRSGLLGCPIGGRVNATVGRNRARRLWSASSLPSPLNTGHLPTHGAARAERVGELASGGRNTQGRTTSAPRTAGGSWPSSHYKPTRRPGHSTPPASLAAASQLPTSRKSAAALPPDSRAVLGRRRKKKVPLYEHVFYSRQSGDGMLGCFELAAEVRPAAVFYTTFIRKRLSQAAARC